MTQTNVLYLGMSEDVLLPFKLVDRIDNLFVIDNVSGSYAARRTQNSTTRAIVNIMNAGTYDACHIYDCIRHCRKEDGEPPLAEYALPRGGSIATDDEERRGNRWQVQFEYDGHAGKLVRYEGNYLAEWPKEVCNITHFVALGAFSNEYLERPTFRRMFDERFAPRCSLFFDYCKWTGLAIPASMRQPVDTVNYLGEAICVAEADTTKPDWVDVMFPKELRNRVKNVSM